MARVSNEIKNSAIERIGAGEEASAVADDIGVSLPTIERWIEAENAEPAGVAPPLASEKKKGGRKQKARPITEETAGQLCAGIFALAAILDAEGHGVWFLDEKERVALAGPFADSLRSLPNPVADAVNQYSAPIVFCTTLSTIVTHKLRKRSQFSGKPIHPVSPPTVAPTQNGPVVARTVAVPSQIPFSPPPEKSPTSETISHLRSALDASHGNLADAPDELEGAFS